MATFREIWAKQTQNTFGNLEGSAAIYSCTYSITINSFHYIALSRSASLNKKTHFLSVKVAESNHHWARETAGWKESWNGRNAKGFGINENRLT